MGDQLHSAWKPIVKIQVRVDPVFEHIFGITGIQKNRELILQFLMQLPGWGFSKKFFWLSQSLLRSYYILDFILPEQSELT